MTKTYVVTMPNHIGAFLQASKCLAALGINITRVSYNKAVDENTLFIDVCGSEDAIAIADHQLMEIGYLNASKAPAVVVLTEFLLEDRPGSVTEVLRLIQEDSFNISYMSSREDGSGTQAFRMGLFVDDPQRFAAFLARAEKLCRVRVIEYNRTEQVFDNSIFYTSFVSGLVQTLSCTEEVRERLLINTNLAMQTLDESGLSPYRTFDSISHFAELLAEGRGRAYAPRITQTSLSPTVCMTLIEPPCGSNTAILCSDNEVLFIDCGYALYREEMLQLFRSLLPGFDSMKKRILITHADVDHCGLLDLFDEVIGSARSAECLQLEFEGQDGFREQNRLHAPYINICKALTGYGTIDPSRITVPWNHPAPEREALEQIGYFDFADMHFEVYEGRGGHLPGEIVLVDYTHHVAFTGDVYVNLKGMTDAQKRYNRYAPILMTSVDTDPVLCAQEREVLFARLGPGNWKICGAHGAIKEHIVPKAQP